MKRRHIALISILLILSLLFAGCSAGGEFDAAASPPYAPPAAGGGFNAAASSSNSSVAMGGGDYAMPSAEYDDGANSGDTITEEVGGASEPDTVSRLNGETGLKIVYTSYLSIQSETFQESYDKLFTLLEENGGHLQNSNISGGYTSTSGYYYNRYADLALRIPADSYKVFLEAVQSVGTVTDMSENSSDITSVYIDTEARLNTLKAQETRLLELLAQAEVMTDLIEIEEKLADVRYQIENYQSQMDTYDNLLSYSTVTISLQEVSDIVIPKDTFGQRLLAALKGSWKTVVNFFDSAVIVLIYVLPFIAVALVTLFIVLRITKKKRAQNKEIRRQLHDARNIGSPYPYAAVGVPETATDNTAAKKEDNKRG